MNIDGQTFLEQLASSPAKGFTPRFSRTSMRLGLGACLSGSELSLLHDAAFYATLCNIAFNGLGGCGGQIKPHREANRISLESRFMAAREQFLSCDGWHALSATQKESIHKIFLNIIVAENNLHR